MNYQQAIPLNSFSLERASNRQPLIVSSVQKVTDVVALMEQTGQDCALVQENQQLVGMLTEKVLVKLAARGTPLTKLSLASVMTKNPLAISVNQLQDWASVTSLWQQNQITHLPIVDGENRPVGVITASTFLASVLNTVTNTLPSQQSPTNVQLTKSEEAEGLIPSLHGGTRTPRPSFYLSLLSQVDGMPSPFEDIMPRRRYKSREEETNGDGGVSLTCVGLAEFQAMFNALSEAVIFADINRRIQILSPAALNLFGYQPEELIGKQTVILYSSEDEYQRQGLRRFNLSTAEQREPYEVNYRRCNGSEFVGETVGTVVKDDTGKIIGFLGIIRDVTQQKQTELQLQNTEYLMQKISEATPNLFYIYDLQQQRNIYANRELASDLGYTPEAIGEMGSEIYTHLFHPDELSRISAHHQKIAASKDRELFEIEYRVRHANGEWLWFYSWEVVFSRNGSGFPTQILGTAINITKRKQLEQELECFFSLSVDLFCIATIDVYLKIVNPAFEKVMGYGQEELLAQPFIDFVHPDDRAATLAEMEKLTIGRPTISFENRYRCQDGSYKWLAWSSFSVPEEGVLYAVGRDITEQKQAEQALRLTQFSVEQAGDAVFWIDRNAQFVYVNEAACQSLGYSRPELLQMSVADVDPNFPLSAWPSHWQEVKAKQNLTLESIHQNQNGTRFPVEVRVNSLVFEQQEYICAFARDISDRKRAESALRESQSRLQAIIDNTSNVIYLKDVQGRYLLINRQYEKLFHFTREQIIGKTDSEIFPAEIAAAVMSNDLKIIAAGMPLEFEETVPQDDGLHTYISIKFPLRNAEGKAYGVCGISTDITERKRTEAALKQAQSALHRTNEELERRVEQRTVELTRSNQELEQFAYIVSHDLQEPLRKMKSFSQLLARECQDRFTENEKAQRYLNYIIDAAERQQQMIKALLNYSRLGRNDSSKVLIDLGAVVEKVLEDLSIPIAETQATVTVISLPAVQASFPQMAQLFLNLIGNGIRFQGSAPPRIKIEAQLQGSEWLISVQDNGMGINPKYAERIFQIFQRLHSRSEYPGTGIGLAICRKIVESHGGRIWVVSEPGQGSSFYFTLPLSPSPS